MNKLSTLINAWDLVDNGAFSKVTSPAVTVLITLYNYSAYITSCLDSVRASKIDGIPGGIEVVIVDDASTDASVKVVEEYMTANTMPIRLAKKVMNTGLADSRNTGLLIARAPLVFILDADNEIRPKCLATHYDTLHSSNHAFAYSLINCYDNDTRKTLKIISDKDWDPRLLVARPCIDAMAMVRREVLLSVGGYSTEYGTILPQGWEDYDLWLKLAQANYTGTLIREVLSDYRSHETSMIHGISAKQRELAIYFTRKFHSLVKQHDDVPELFGVSRKELAISNGQTAWLQPSLRKRKPGLTQRLLGEKMCRSIGKRLASAYCWICP